MLDIDDLSDKADVSSALGFIDDEESLERLANIIRGLEFSDQK